MIHDPKFFESDSDQHVFTTDPLGFGVYGIWLDLHDWQCRKRPLLNQLSNRIDSKARTTRIARRSRSPLDLLAGYGHFVENEVGSGMVGPFSSMRRERRKGENEFFLFSR